MQIQQLDKRIKKLNDLEIAKLSAKLIENTNHFNHLVYDNQTNTFKGIVIGHIKADFNGNVELSIQELKEEFNDYYKADKQGLLETIIEQLN